MKLPASLCLIAFLLAALFVLPCLSSVSAQSLGDYFYMNGNVGVGTTNPVSANGSVGKVLEVATGGSSNATTVLSSSGSSASNTGGILEARSTASLSGGDSRLGQLHWLRTSDVTSGKLSSYFQLYVNNDGAYTEALRVLPNGYLGIGTNPGYKLDVNGDIRATGHIYANGSTLVADYVFDPNYRLRDLDYVEQFVRTNRHLEGLPAAEDQISWNKLSLQEVNQKLLEKIEEQTLYTIQEHKANMELANRVARLEKELQDLKQQSNSSNDN